MKHKFEICILGNGPTARICSYFTKTPHALIGKQNNIGLLSTTDIVNNSFNLAPIFPVYDSYIYNELWKNDSNNHVFLDSSKRGNILVEFDNLMPLISNAKPHSYVTQCLKEKQDFGTKENIVLAYKLFGKVIFEREINRLLAKVKKNYDGAKPTKKIGYVNKLSPYYEKISNIKIDIFFWMES